MTGFQRGGGEAMALRRRFHFRSRAICLRASRYSSPEARRSRLRWPCRFLSVSRLCTEEPVGRVAVRGLRRANAASNSSTSRSSAAARLRACVRSREALTRKRPSRDRREARRRRMRPLSHSLIAEQLSKSNKRTTRVLTLLTFCPPGPEERVKVTSVQGRS